MSDVQSSLMWPCVTECHSMSGPTCDESKLTTATAGPKDCALQNGAAGIFTQLPPGA